MKLPVLAPVVAITLLFAAVADASQDESGGTIYLGASPPPAPPRKHASTPVPSSSSVPARNTTPAPKSATQVPQKASTPAAKPTPAAVVVPRPAATPVLVKHENVNDIARFIAGLPPEHDAQLTELAKTPEWIAYAASMNNQWPHFDYVKLAQIRIWSPKELEKIHIS